VFTLQWKDVDFAAGTVTRWSRCTGKAPEHVVFPFGVVPDLKALLERQRERTTELAAAGCITPYVFHQNGKPMKYCYGAFKSACRAAGIPGRILHDLRRTGARRLRALGMGDRDIAESCGWQTTLMVARYLGRDPAGVTERLRLRMAEAEARTRTFPARSWSVEE
jgi:integrase